ncbi:MAG: NfeD family protein [Bacteroidota bacterium]|nr:NfeD family protein [Bacteroidota bacterium]
MLTVAIALLILLSILLLIIEILILPGIMIAGVGGFLLMALAIFLTYKNYGSAAGHYILLSSIAFFIVAFIYSLRSKTWNRLALHSEIKGKVNMLEEDKIAIGDKGVTISKLAPMGKVKVNNTIVEAKSLGIYIAENTKVEVLKVNESNIIVKPLNN